MLVERPEPQISTADQVKMKVVRVGICGTDREEYSSGRAVVPAGAQELVIGHEMIGQVVQTGAAVTRVQPGDYAAFTVRRGCGQCPPCLMNRSDMCETHKYVERGIYGADGFEAEYVVDSEQYVVKVPAALQPVGVLCEPLSVCEKGIDTAVRMQAARIPGADISWLAGRRCLVCGLGPIGLLAALALRLRGATVYGTDIVDSASARPQWLQKIGGQYVDGRDVPSDKIGQTLGPMDLIFEASGVPAVAFNLIMALDFNGVMIYVGVAGGEHPLQIAGDAVLRQMVLRNLLLVGTVNASRDHFQMAVDDLVRARLMWGNHIDSLITNRHSYADFATALTEHTPDEIKVVIEWA
jgi:glucose 1-dehydrogenase